MRPCVFVFALMLGCGHIEGVTAPASTDAGGDDATTTDGAPVPPNAIGTECSGCKIVFVTSKTVKGDGVNDALCAALASASANARLMGRTFHAWRSVTGRSAAMAVSHAGAPYVRTDGTVVAASWNDLTSGSLAAPIDVDERGQRLADAVSFVWTGTTTSGDLMIDGMPVDCVEWASMESGRLGFVGLWASVDQNWTQSSNGLCTNPAHVYCFED